MSDESCNSCPGKIKVPTEKEVEALTAMKEIKERVRELKKRLVSMDAKDTEEKETMEYELVFLKKEWNRWELKRKDAARERMIILGHEEGL